MGTVIQFILLASMVSGIGLGDRVIIHQQDGPPCPEGERCLSLSECLANSDTCFTSNTTLLFDPGDHYTDGVETFVVVEGVTNLTLAGKSNSGVRIHCNSTDRVGFGFKNITNLSMVGLSIVGCGMPVPVVLMYCVKEASLWFPADAQAAFVLSNVENFHAVHLEVTQSYGIGLLGCNVLGHSSVTHSSFTYNNIYALSYHHKNPQYCRNDAFQLVNGSTWCTGGNTVFVFQDPPTYITPCSLDLPMYTLKIHHTIFKYGVNLNYVEELFDRLKYINLAGGLTIVIRCPYYVNVEVLNMSADSNVGYDGANVVISFADRPDTKSHPQVLIMSSSIVNGNSVLGLFAAKALSGGLHFWHGHLPIGDPGCPDTCSTRSRAVLLILNTNFINNSAFHGGAVYAVSNVNPDLGEALHSAFAVFESNFISNTGVSAIIHVLSTRDKSALDVRFVKSNFTKNRFVFGKSHVESFREDIQATLLLRGLHDTQPKHRVHDCVFEDNHATGLCIEETTVEFVGKVTFQGNTGDYGGGISMANEGRFLLGSGAGPPVALLFKGNTAEYGGGIYYDDTCLLCEESTCFYDLHEHVYGALKTVLVTMIDNTAKIAGNAIYGGNLDKCLHFIHDLWLSNVHPIERFDHVFNFQENASLTEISSDPQQVCFCENQKPVCGLMVKQVSVYRGALFSVEAVGIGQMNGTVPAVVVGEVREGYSGMLGRQQHAQPLGTECGKLTYSVTTKMNYSELKLDINFERKRRIRSLPKTIGVAFQMCPVGFSLDPDECNCIKFLKKRGVSCDIDTLTFRWQSPLWVGYSQNKILAHDNCPFDYCKAGTTLASLPNTNAQCEFSRSGILCGECKEGLSSVFGTSRCKKCSNNYLSLLIPIALAGFLLVALLIYCDLTVAKGTLNGLIFYANIVRVNHNIIFPAGESNVLTVFIAWLNLDIGIETCFYDGMDEYGRTWLQFVFPVYVWVIVGIIILACWYSSLAVRITGSHAVAVLATLFLLSYTKIQRTVLTALSLTVIPSHDGDSSVVWLYDGNVPYVNGKHAALFLMAVFVAVAFILPFTLLVLLGPLLQSKFSHRMMKLKLTPILDAYQGPYKDKFRCWTGVMLVMRSFLLLSFSVNALGSPRLNMLLIVTSMIVLLGFVYTIGSVYKQLSVNVLDSFYIVNLAILAAWTEFNRQGGSNFKRNQAATSYTLVGVAFVVFLAIFLYHAGLQVKTFLHHHNIRLPFPLRLRQTEAQDRELLALQNEPPEPVVNPRVPTVTFVDIRARESLLDSYPSN